MTGKAGVAREDHVVADLAIVGDVYVGHQQAVVADGCFEFVIGAAVNGDALADFGMITDFYSRVFVAELEVLWAIIVWMAPSKTNQGTNEAFSTGSQAQ